MRLPRRTAMAKPEDTIAAVQPGHRIFYGWWIVGAGTVIWGLIAAVTWQATGIFFVALEDEFHWSRTLLSGAFAVGRAEGALMGPVEGVIADRLGGRRTMMVGLVICSAGFFLFSTINNPAMFYVSYLLITAGAGLVGGIPFITTLNHWFIRRRTTAISFYFVGGALGGILIPLLAWGIVAHGWRIVAGGIGGFLLIVGLPIIMLIRDRPEPYGLRPDGDPPVEEGSKGPVIAAATASMAPPSTMEFTARQALRTRAFWLVSLSHAATLMLNVTVVVHLVPYLTDQDLSLPLAGIVVLVLAITSGFSNLIGGWFGDRVDKRYVISTFMAVQGVSILFLLAAHSFSAALVYAGIAGLGVGGRAPAMVSIRGDYFGRKAFGIIFGLSMLPGNIGSLIMPLLAGFMHDTLGSYTVSFITLAALVFAGAVLILFARSPSRPSSG